MIIAAYAGTGKSTLANTYPHEFEDFVCMPYKYLLTSDGDRGEAGKANPTNIMRDDWPYNYISAIKSNMGTGKHLLIPTDMFVLMLLREKNIPYMLCYPRRDAKEIYRERFQTRGNTAQFIDIFIGRWDDFISAFEHDTYGKHTVLRADEFLVNYRHTFLRRYR